jgi:tetratricopeptide (TPR) repeat protein
MNLEKEISAIEHTNDWKAGIQLVGRVKGTEPQIYLRVMFLLLDLLVEGKYSQDEHDFAAMNLKDIFDRSAKKFSENSEFLFFAGVMAYIAEWYFGMDNVAQATAMLEKAMTMDPNNLLYKWGYYSRVDQRAEQNTDLKLQLSEKLLFRETATLNWLKSRGLLGKYVLGTIEGTYDRLLAKKVSS